MEYIERLEKTLSELENNSGKLANLPELVKGINELISHYRETNDSVVKSQKDLEKIEGQLSERIEELQKALKLEQESKDELLNKIRSVLTANNKEQLDAVNSITTVVNNKIAVAESNLTVKTTEIDNDVKLVDSKISENGNKLDAVTKNISSIEEKLCTYGDKTLADMSELKLLIPIIKRTQIFSIVTAVLALVACILYFVM